MDTLRLKVRHKRMYFCIINISFKRQQGNPVLFFVPVPHATNRFAIPHSKASLLDSDLPVNIRSKVLERPTVACSRTIPPSIKGIPKSTLNQNKILNNYQKNKIPNRLLSIAICAVSSITLKSHIKANSKPPATA